MRRYGFSTDFQASYVLENAYVMGKEPTDSVIELLITGLVAETRQLLGAYRPVLLALSVALCRGV